MNIQHMRAHRAYPLELTYIKDSVFEHNNQGCACDMQLF